MTIGGRLPCANTAFCKVSGRRTDRLADSLVSIAFTFSSVVSGGGVGATFSTTSAVAGVFFTGGATVSLMISTACSSVTTLVVPASTFRSTTAPSCSTVTGSDSTVASVETGADTARAMTSGTGRVETSAVSEDSTTDVVDAGLASGLDTTDTLRGAAPLIIRVLINFAFFQMFFRNLFSFVDTFFRTEADHSLKFFDLLTSPKARATS